MSGPFKVNTRSAWASENPVLMAGEPGIESQTGNLKIGDGRTPWNVLPYHGCPGYWGSFWDTTSQTATANTPTAILLRKNDLDNRGVKVISDSRITVDHPGIYSFTFSVQFSNTNEQIHDVNVWLRKNDSGASGDVADSDSKFSIIAKHGGVDGNVIGTVNFVLKLAAADYIELIWATSNAAAYIHSEGAATSPFAHPGIPGIICTVTQVASA
jgi:hypothetical protein